MTLALALAIALGAVAQALSGLGFSLVCGALLVAALGPAEGVRVNLVLSVLLNAAVLAQHHRHVHWRGAALLLAPAVAATPLCVLVLRHAPTRLAEALAGLAALVGALALLRGLRWPAASGRRGAVAAGVASAAMNAAAGIGGPAVALWADNAGWSPARLRATVQPYFLGLNAVGLLSLGRPHEPAGRWAVLTAALVLGLLVGRRVAPHVGAAAARRTTLWVAATGGAVVLVRAAL